MIGRRSDYEFRLELGAREVVRPERQWTSTKLPEILSRFTADTEADHRAHSGVWRCDE